MNDSTKYSLIYKKMWLLFIVIITSNIISLIAQILKFNTIGNFCTIIFALIYAFILIILSSEHDYYKAAGITQIISVIISFFDSESYFIGSSLLISSVGLILAILNIYFEFTAHSELLYKSDYTMGAKWDKLKKWTIGLLVLSLISLFLVLLLPILTIINVLVSLVGIVVVDIIKYIYLYQSAKIYKNLSEENNVSRETL